MTGLVAHQAAPRVAQLAGSAGRAGRTDPGALSDGGIGRGAHDTLDVCRLETRRMLLGMQELGVGSAVTKRDGGTDQAGRKRGNEDEKLTCAQIADHRDW